MTSSPGKNRNPKRTDRLRRAEKSKRTRFLSASNEVGGLHGAIRAERAWRARQSNAGLSAPVVDPLGADNVPFVR
jgi:hypothetical protein